MDIKFKSEYCALNDYTPSKVESKYVSLYVRLIDKCQANCKFCEYHDKDKTFAFDLKKFKLTIDKLLKEGIELRRISFTGGEPTLNVLLLEKCINYVKNVSPETFIIINTNGAYLDDVVNINNIDSIALSRHHYNDNINIDIFRTNQIPDAKHIKEVAKKTNVLHLSCNLIKGYIDNSKRMLKYLEHASDIGVYDVGFVGLMSINEYAKSNTIDLASITIESDQIVENKMWHYKDVCKCFNYLFLPKKGNKMVKAYARHRCKHNVEMGSMLVFDGSYLRKNFNDTIIE